MKETSSRVLSVATLDIKKLKAVYLKVDMEYDNRKNAAVAILSKLSRDLLEICKSFGGCLAVPQRDLCTIMMIVDSELLKNEVLVEFLRTQKMNIKIECPCDSLCIESALPFAVFYFMEKVKWLRIGKCFVQDGFLSWKNFNIPRIQIMTHCGAEGNVYFKFTAEIVRIHPFEHYILDADERFNLNSDSEPITRNIRPRWVTCLPKLGKGQIKKIHRKIPDDAPFENYGQMVSYWKKTYGYDLPPTEPEVYYDIHFHNGQNMLYPWYCILTGAPEVLPLRVNSTDTRDALATFLKAFKEAGIQICGSTVDSNAEESASVKAYMDVMSMKPTKTIPKIAKVTRNASAEAPPPIRKIYPKIPMKRTNSAEGEVPTKKRRNAFAVPVD